MSAGIGLKPAEQKEPHNKNPSAAYSNTIDVDGFIDQNHKLIHSAFTAKVCQWNMDM